MVNSRSREKPPAVSRVEERAAVTDRWVKEHLANDRKLLESKNFKLKALRLAREMEERSQPPAEDGARPPLRPKRRMRQIWVSGAAEDKSKRG
jgi:hypothetical protein